LAAPAPQPERQIEKIVYAVRADPDSAGKVDEILRQVAEPTTLSLPPQMSIANYLDRICTAPSGASVRAPTGTDRPLASFTPCLRSRRNVRVMVKEGDTLEGIATRLGLALTQAPSLRVAESASADETRPADPTRLRPGEYVVADQVPVWSPFTVNTSKVASRAALISLFAEAFGCAGQEAEVCLTRKRIFLLRMSPEATSHRQSPRTLEVTPVPGAHRIISSEILQAFAVTDAVGASTAAASDGVLPRQWPYDADLISRTLVDATRQAPMQKALIGVADAGLGSSAGAPLPRSVFPDPPFEVEPPGQRFVDDNGNGYSDDFIGAGSQRPGEIEPGGDVALCPQPPPYETWDEGDRSAASHGAIAASLAVGLKLREAAPTLASAMPRIAFYRLVQRACEKGAALSAFPAEVATAFEYLVQADIDIINISYLGESNGGSTIAALIAPRLEHEERLLILPAGNDLPANLDEDAVCPACLADADRFGLAARRTIVVGAAESSLKRASFSGFGARTVKLYAPAEPAGALDIAGLPADDAGAATSYSAPLVAFAAGLMRSLGIDKVWHIRNRLLLASWPLLEEQGGPDPSGARVLDLTKAAAVRHASVEAKERAPDGSWLRRTYVGRFPDGVTQVALCDSAYPERLYNALQIEAPAANGNRTVRAYERRIDPVSRKLMTRTATCRPGGVLKFLDLRDGPQDIPWERVTQVLFRWIPNS
jgi:hypothetical protein